MFDKLMRQQELKSIIEKLNNINARLMNVEKYIKNKQKKQDEGISQ